MIVLVDSKKQVVLGAGENITDCLAELRSKLTVSEFIEIFDILHKDDFNTYRCIRDPSSDIYFIKFIGYHENQNLIQKLDYFDIIKLSDGLKLDDDNFLYCDYSDSFKMKKYNDYPITASKSTIDTTLTPILPQS